MAARASTILTFCAISGAYSSGPDGSKPCRGGWHSGGYYAYQPALETVGKVGGKPE